jgi:hypothetical protein
VTVILDSGADANSYSDAQPRIWRATAGLWKTDAKDNSGSTHPTGYSAAQLWSVTAAQWKAMYDAEVTAYNAEVAAYNGMVGERDTWIGYAHSDPAVWTNRYNTGYAAGQTDGQAAVLPASSAPGTPAYGTVSGMTSGWGGWPGYGTITLSSVANYGLTFFSGNSVVAPKSGFYIVGMQATIGVHNTANAGIQAAGLPRGVTFGTTSATCDADSDPGSIGFSFGIYLAAGESFTFQGSQSWGVSAATCFVAFVPTPSYPH